MKITEALSFYRKEYPHFPEIGPDGSPFVDIVVSIKNNAQRIWRVRPCLPLREYETCDWQTDNDGEEYAVNVQTIKLSEEEYATAMTEYNSSFPTSSFVSGVPTITGWFMCQNGTECAGLMDMGGSSWIWTEVIKCEG